MSRTPICDRWEYESYSSGLVVPLNVAKELENELADKEKQLAEARAEIDGLTLMATNASMEPARRLIQKNKELHAVIEQMREALRAWTRTPNIPLCEAIKTTEAALEAAERVG